MTEGQPPMTPRETPLTELLISEIVRQAKSNWCAATHRHALSARQEDAIDELARRAGIAAPLSASAGRETAPTPLKVAPDCESPAQDAAIIAEGGEYVCSACVAYNLPPHIIARNEDGSPKPISPELRQAAQAVQEFVMKAALPGSGTAPTPEQETCFACEGMEGEDRGPTPCAVCDDSRRAPAVLNEFWRELADLEIDKGDAPLMPTLIARLDREIKADEHSAKIIKMFRAALAAPGSGGQGTGGVTEGMVSEMCYLRCGQLTHPGGIRSCPNYREFGEIPL